MIRIEGPRGGPQHPSAVEPHDGITRVAHADSIDLQVTRRRSSVPGQDAQGIHATAAIRMHDESCIVAVTDRQQPRTIDLRADSVQG